MNSLPRNHQCHRSHHWRSRSRSRSCNHCRSRRWRRGDHRRSDRRRRSRRRGHHRSPRPRRSRRHRGEHRAHRCSHRRSRSRGSDRRRSRNGDGGGARCPFPRRLPQHRRRPVTKRRTRRRRRRTSRRRVTIHKVLHHLSVPRKPHTRLTEVVVHHQRGIEWHFAVRVYPAAFFYYYSPHNMPPLYGVFMGDARRRAFFGFRFSPLGRDWMRVTVPGVSGMPSHNLVHLGTATDHGSSDLYRHEPDTGHWTTVPWPPPTGPISLAPCPSCTAGGCDSSSRPARCPGARAWRTPAVWRTLLLGFVVGHTHAPSHPRTGLRLVVAAHQLRGAHRLLHAPSQRPARQPPPATVVPPVGAAAGVRPAAHPATRGDHQPRGAAWHCADNIIATATGPAPVRRLPLRPRPPADGRWLCVQLLPPGHARTDRRSLQPGHRRRGRPAPATLRHADGRGGKRGGVCCADTPATPLVPRDDCGRGWICLSVPVASAGSWPTACGSARRPPCGMHVWTVSRRPTAAPPHIT